MVTPPPSISRKASRSTASGEALARKPALAAEAANGRTAQAIRPMQIEAEVRADPDQPYAGSRRFIAGTGELAAGLFLLAIVFQTLSSPIIPRCYG